MATSIFPLQSAIKKILDNPNSRPKLPNKSLTKDETSTGGGVSVGGSFGDDDHYGKGSAPAVALNIDNVAVAIHEGLTSGTLDYKVGQVSGSKVSWSKRQKFDTGKQPSVAINGSLVVEVHEAHNNLTGEDRIWYRLGSLDGSKINFSESHAYDKGKRPAVAINNQGVVVEVHKSENFDTLYYHVGSMYGNTIKFGDSHDYSKGIRPSVDINNNGLVVEVHQSESHTSLWYRLGQVEGSKIKWRNNGESVKYAEGKRPDVAITSDGQITVVHQKDDTLWYRIGQAKGDSIDWLMESTTQYSKNGATPAVACNDAKAVEIHSSGEKELSASVLTLPASQPKWIKKRGQYSYLYFSMDEESINERTVTRETIKVEPGAPFLIANLTKGKDSAEFPNGATLSVSGPDGVVYDAQRPSDDRTEMIKSGSSLQGLIIKEPRAGDYTVSLGVPANTEFSFSFLTLPFKDVAETLGQSKRSIRRSATLQKRAGKGKGNANIDPAIDFIGGVWMTFVLLRRNLYHIEEVVGYSTGSNLQIENEANPANVAEAANIINQNIRIPNFDRMIEAPDNVTSAPPGGPVLEYVVNGAGAVQWLHAEIRREHLNTGTDPNDRTRAFVRRLSDVNTDQAGHIVAARLGGTGRQTWNIIPQNGHFNTGSYRAHVEAPIYDAVDRYGTVRAWFIIRYEDLLRPNRPTRFDILYRLPDGREYIGDLYNPEFVPRGT